MVAPRPFTVLGPYSLSKAQVWVVRGTGAGAVAVYWGYRLSLPPRI